MPAVKVVMEVPVPEPVPPPERVQLHTNGPAAPVIAMAIAPLDAALQAVVRVVTTCISHEMVDGFEVLKILPQASVNVTVIGHEVLTVTEGGVNIALVLSVEAEGSLAKVPPQEADHATVYSAGFVPTGKANDTAMGVPDETVDGIPLTSGARLEFFPAIKEKLKNTR